MTYLVYEDGDKWRISRSDGQLDLSTKSYSLSEVREVMRDMTILDEDYQVYKLFKRAPQKLRYLN